MIVRFWKQGADKKCLYLRKRDAGGWRNLMRRIFIILYTKWYSTDMIRKYVMGWNHGMREANEKLRGLVLKIVKGPP